MNITNVEKFKMYHPDGTEDTAITWVRITSSDGDTWSSKNSGTTKDLYGITYGKN